MELTLEQISILLNAVLVIIGIVFVKDYRKYKSLLKEAGEALGVTYKALEDKNITPEEAEELVKEYEDVYWEIKKLRM